MSDSAKRGKLAFRLLEWAVRIATAGLLGHAAMGKFTGDPYAIEVFSHIGMGIHGRILIGLIEMLAALLIVSPQSSVYGALVGLGVMVGAVIAHLTMIGVHDLAHAVLVAAGCVAILYMRRGDASFLRNLWDR